MDDDRGGFYMHWFRLVFALAVACFGIFMLVVMITGIQSVWHQTRIQMALYDACMATYGGATDIHTVPLACRTAFPYSSQQSASQP